MVVASILLVSEGAISLRVASDMVVENKIILELKAISKLADIHTAQAVNYLVATGYELAILLNFGAPRLEHKRVIRRQKNLASNDTNEYE